MKVGLTKLLVDCYVIQPYIFHKGKFEGASKNNRTILNTKDISSYQNVVSVLMKSMKRKKHVVIIFTQIERRRLNHRRKHRSTIRFLFVQFSCFLVKVSFSAVRSIYWSRSRDNT